MTALFCIKWRRGRHLENMTAYQKSDSFNQSVNAYCVGLLTWRTILPNFIPIPFEFWNDEALGFFEDGRPNTRKRKTRKRTRNRTTTATTRWWEAILYISFWSKNNFEVWNKHKRTAQTTETLLALLSVKQPQHYARECWFQWNLDYQCVPYRSIPMFSTDAPTWRWNVVQREHNDSGWEWKSSSNRRDLVSS